VRISVVESAGLNAWLGSKARKRSLDPAVVSSWAEGVRYVLPLYGDRLRPGGRYLVAHRLLGRTVLLVHTVEEVTPSYGWRIRADRLRATVTIALSLRPRPEPAVDLTVDVIAAGTARFARPALTWSVRRSARRAVRRLAGRLKSGTTQRPTVR